MDYKKGLRVTHSLRPDWGIGEVLTDSAGDTVKVFFVGVGEKTLSLKGFDLLKVDGAEAKHPILDNLKITAENGIKYRSLPESIQMFLKEFPGGFYGGKFASRERDYKVSAHLLMKESLSKDEFRALLDKRDYEELCRRVLKAVNSTNLIFPNEKMSLKDGLKSPEHKRGFSEVLYDHLFGDRDLEKRFRELCEFLEEIKAAKWTVATYFLYFMFPDHHMFIKPTITKEFRRTFRFRYSLSPRSELGHI